MRCKEVREIVAESGAEELPAAVREHITSCSACEAEVRGWRLWRAGFRSLAQEPAPDPSLGFPARVVRRLEDAAIQDRSEAEFFERVGRRFVYATLLLTLTLLLALALPASGPLRGPTTADLAMAQSEVVTMRSAAIFADAFADNPNGFSVSYSTAGEEGQK